MAAQDLIFFITARATLNTLLESDRTVHADTLLTIKYVTANTIPTRPAITATTIPMTTGTCTELVLVGVGDAVWPPRAGVGGVGTSRRGVRGMTGERGAESAPGWMV